MKIVDILKSKIDRTVKIQFQTYDKKIVESCIVFFDKKEAKVNICISSQLGCECNCVFCSTGNKKFVRNLSCEEILQQVELIIEKMPQIEDDKFEITFMGTGEPLRNKDVVFEAINIFSEQYQNLFRINVSSIFPEIDVKIDEIKSLKCKIHFQYSLHFLSDAMRKNYFRKELAPIKDVLQFLNQVANVYDEKYCINYILFENLNDTMEDVMGLAKIINNNSAYLKVSEYCPISSCSLKPSKKYIDFVRELKNQGILCKKFSSQGTDIHAACGHLLADIEF